MKFLESTMPLKPVTENRFSFGPILWCKDNEINILFRLYAPDCETVDLILEEESRGALHAPANHQVIAMESDDQGWFYHMTNQAKVGSLYRFQIDHNWKVPDPASRFQPLGVMGPSQVMDRKTFEWQDHNWKGRPWEESIIYELHVGTFSDTGNYAGVESHLDELIALGITAIELMPVAAFAGTRNWGYDGVLPYSPESSYGTPDELKHLIQTAHNKGLMVFLDVVYNHFGPEGNYLHTYAKSFFTDRHKSLWGEGINLDGPQSGPVREFFIQNALYWLEEFHFDGLRLDAIHAIQDDSPIPMLQELAIRVQNGPGRERHIHLILENDLNAASWLNGGVVMHEKGDTGYYTAQWNDDLHHILHTLATGQTDSYYVDYAQDPIKHLKRVVEDGFAYQGETSQLRHGKHRGEDSRHLPATAFISFLQNHDQVGNHPFGSRMAVLTSPAMIRANLTLVMLLPQIPMLFMGEEWLAEQPFPFFCDFHDELANLVREGRRQEFSHAPGFSDPEKQALIPDPNLEATFKSAILKWSDREKPQHRVWLQFYQHLIQVRKQVIIPLLKEGFGFSKPKSTRLGDKAIALEWRYKNQTGKNHHLWMMGNWSQSPLSIQCPLQASLLAESQEGCHNALKTGILNPECVIWLYVNPPS